MDIRNSLMKYYTRNQHNVLVKFSMRMKKKKILKILTVNNKIM